MPISRDEFEAGEIVHIQHILEILLDQRERAYSYGELVQVVNFRPNLTGIRSWREYIVLMGDRPPISDDELTTILDTLVDAGAIHTRAIGGIVYYLA